MRDSLLLLVLFLSIFVNLACADNRAAASLSPADIQAAVNAASPGDTVILPAGEFRGFNSTITIPNGISIKGQGKNATKLRKTDTSRIDIFRLNEAGQASTYPVEMSGFSLYGCGDQSTLDTGINIARGIKDFKIHDLDLQGFGYSGLIVHGYSYGVIWNCRFIDCYAPGNGYGIGVLAEEPGDVKPGDASWTRPVVFGGNEWVFVEDCYFSNQRHAIASNFGGRYVFRYNTCVNNKRSEFIDVHGYAGTTRGARAWEVYHNNLTGDSVNWPDGIGMTGGDGVIFNNTMQGNIAFPIFLSDDSCEGSYPGPDQIRSCYIWGNNEDGNPVDKAGSGSNNDIAVYCTQFLQQDRDFFLYPKPEYTPYPYPHPLRQSNPLISLSLSSISFVSVEGGSNPGSQSFSITNSGGGVLNWAISDDAEWLACSLPTGQGNATIGVSINHSDLSVGTYNATISISSSNAKNSPQKIRVTLIKNSSFVRLSTSIAASVTSGAAPLKVEFTGRPITGCA
jgi:hypothetical protein